MKDFLKMTLGGAILFVYEIFVWPVTWWLVFCFSVIYGIAHLPNDDDRFQTKTVTVTHVTDPSGDDCEVIESQKVRDNRKIGTLVRWLRCPKSGTTVIKDDYER